MASRSPQPVRMSPRAPLSTKRKVLLILLALISLPVVYLVVNSAITFTRQTIATSAAKEKVATARQSAVLESDSSLSNLVAALEQTGLIQDELASSKVDVCYVTHSDAGWMIASWYQDCYLRYTSGYLTTATKDTVLAHASALTDTFGEVETYTGMYQSFPCEIASKDFKETLRYRPANSPISKDNTRGPFGCGLPSQLQGIGSVSGPIMFDDELSVRKFSSFAPDDVDNSQNQLWVVYENHYYSEDLGCGVGLLCDSPRSKPVQAP